MQVRASMTSIQSRGRTLWAFLLILLVVLLAGSTSWAQTFTGSISGTVTDATGAAVKGVNLELVNLVTQDKRLQVSNELGAYSFTNVAPGSYKIGATAAGFKEFVRSDMVLRANTAAIVNVELTVGGTTEQVTVSAGGAVLLDTASANTSTTLDERLLQSLPNNTLQPLNFVYALAGTTESQAGSWANRSSSQDQSASLFGLNGGRSGESLILVDGASSTAIDWGGLMVSPIQDSVQEQQVVSNVYDAQYQRGGEGVVTLITRSGTEKFHGEVYDFMRNNALDANSWWNNNNSAPRGKFHRNQFGGNIGGPLWASKHLFFFGGYEALRQPGGNGLAVASVPTEEEKNGDFSNTVDSEGKQVVIYDPFSTKEVTDSEGTKYFTRTPFPGNKIPAGMMDAVGKNIAHLYPNPTRGGQGGHDVNNFTKMVGSETVNDKFDVRVDWFQSEKHRLFGRVSDRIRQNSVPDCVFCNGADSNYVTENRGVQGVLNDTWTPTPNWVIDSYGAYTRWLEGQTLVGYGKYDPSTIGLPKNIFQVPLLPVVNAGNYQGMGAGDSSYDRYVRYVMTGLVNVTRQLTRHTLKFGFNYDVSLMNNRKNGPGSFNFSGAMTSCDAHLNSKKQADGPCAATLGSGLTGNPIADMLLGVGNGETHLSMDPAFSVHAYGIYVQDDWRVTPRLTINAGLRYENQRPATERYNRIAYFSPVAVNPISTAFGSTVKGAFEYAGVDGRGREAYEPDDMNLGPRLGVAYRFTDKLVARMGGGFFYGPATAMLSFDDGGQSPGYTATTPWIGTQGDNGYIPSALVSNPFPNGQNQPTGNALGGSTYVGYSPWQMWAKLPHPVANIYQWSGDVQYQFNSHSVFQMGYTGVRGRKLLYGDPQFDYNQLPTADLALGPKLDELVANPFAGVITDPNSFLSAPKIARNRLMRPFPEYGSMILTRSTPGARSRFDAFSAKYNYSFHNGLTSITTYQWSKNQDNGSEALIGWSIGNSWRDFYNTKQDYSLSTRDVPHSFAEAWLYQLPYGTGRKFGGNAPQIVRQTIGGWNVSGVIRLNSGLPLWNAVSWGWPGNNLNNYGFPGYALPDLVGNPKPQHRTRNNWIDPAAFQGVDENGNTMSCANQNCQPFKYRYGNEPQHYDALREAATKNIDLGIGKEFGTERIHAELRADFLNMFNHPIYGGAWNITNHFGWGPVGVVNGTRNDQRNIQVALKVMF